LLKLTFSSKRLQNVKKLQRKQDPQNKQSSPVALKDSKKEEKIKERRILQDTEPIGPEENVTPENFQKFFANFSEKIQSLRLAFQYFYEFCQLVFVRNQQLPKL
jgi:hypothetical protein